MCRAVGALCNGCCGCGDAARCVRGQWVAGRRRRGTAPGVGLICALRVMVCRKRVTHVLLNARTRPWFGCDGATAEPVLDSSPSLFQPSASVLSVPGVRPGTGASYARPPTGVSTTRSAHHVGSYHQSDALGTPQELGANMLPLPPEGQLFINTSTWGNYFHEHERDQAISQVPRAHAGRQLAMYART